MEVDTGVEEAVSIASHLQVDPVSLSCLKPRNLNLTVDVGLFLNNFSGSPAHTNGKSTYRDI